MSSSNNQPDALQMPFANNGDKSTIPSSATGTNKASLTEGFPQITSESIADGGIPPSREDFNALGNISTSHNYFMQNGGGYTFVPAVSTAIGGYPKGALLWYYPSSGNPQLLVSTKNNNTDNFNTNQSYIGIEGSGKSWEIVTVSGSNYVDLTSNQTVGGYKTFTSQVTKTNSSVNADTIFVNKNTSVTKGAAPSANVESRWRLTDSSSGDGNAALIGGVTFSYSTSMRTGAILQVGKPEAGSTSTASMGIYYPATGDAYTSAPTPATADDSTKIATTSYVKANLSSYALDSAVVKTSGNQSISGIKTFSDRIMFNGSTGLSYNTLSTAAKGTAPSSNVTTSFSFLDSAFSGSYNATISRVNLAYNSDGSTAAKLQAFKPEANSIASSSIAIYYPASGNPYTEAPTPATSDNSTKIATTAFVKAQNYVSQTDLTAVDVVVEYSDGVNGYMKYSNGVIYQWGERTAGTLEDTVTLPTPFSTTNYSVSVQHIYDGNTELWPANISTKTTSSFKIWSRGGAVSAPRSWIAIGK